MDPRTRTVFLGFLAVIIALMATATVLLGQAPLGQTPPLPPEAEAVEGVVVSVDSAGLANVRGFELRATDGSILAFSLERLENEATFPPGHLVEHQATASAIVVWFRSEGGVAYAIVIEDAEPSG